MIKANNETEDKIQTTLLTDGQYIAIKKYERIDALFTKDSYLDQNGKVIFSFFREFPIESDEVELLKIGGQIQFNISNLNFVYFNACERHSDQLMYSILKFIKLNI